MGLNNTKSLEFRMLLLEYYGNLNRIIDDYKRKVINKEVYDRLAYLNIAWFEDMKEFSNYTYLEIKDKRILSKKKFLLPVDKRCPGCDDGKPYKVIKYRGIEIPVYDDDYGQQDFAVIDGEEVSGGSYNFLAHLDFMKKVDHVLENKYIKGKYDMYKEVFDLFPEYNN